jgi:hypothetical protein
MLHEAALLQHHEEELQDMQRIQTEYFNTLCKDIMVRSEMQYKLLRETELRRRQEEVHQEAQASEKTLSCSEEGIELLRKQKQEQRLLAGLSRQKIPDLLDLDVRQVKRELKETPEIGESKAKGDLKDCSGLMLRGICLRAGVPTVVAGCGRFARPGAFRAELQKLCRKAEIKQEENMWRHQMHLNV